MFDQVTIETYWPREVALDLLRDAFLFTFFVGQGLVQTFQYLQLLRRPCLSFKPAHQNTQNLFSHRRLVSLNTNMKYSEWLTIDDWNVLLPIVPILPSRFPCCVLLALSWNTTNEQMKIRVQISWVGQSTKSYLPSEKTFQIQSRYRTRLCLNIYMTVEETTIDNIMFLL